MRQPAKTIDQIEAAEKKVEEPVVEKKLVPKQLPTGLYIIVWNHGAGLVPEDLSGMYTSIVRAEAAIANHLAGKFKEAA